MLTRFLDRLGTRWQRLSEKVADGALAHARHHEAARIFCGHTHAALHQQWDGCDYYNCGAWIDEHLTYITVGEDGVQIHEYARPTEPANVDPLAEDAESVGQSEFEAGDLVEDGEYQNVAS